MDVDKVQELFWELTDRDQHIVHEIKPSNYHLWGKETNILEKSPTLRNLVLTNRLECVQNYKATFHDVLTELGLHYTIEKVPSNKPHLRGVMYEIHSTPRWSFGHFESREDIAILHAAKKGLSFFMEMAT